MQEDFLHHVWKYQKFMSAGHLKTNQGENLQILSVGRHNQDQSGPDFFNAKIKIGEQVWAGNIEIHIKSSDWYAHQHENDPAYDSVILHVIWEDDVEIYRANQTIIPSLSLKHLIDESVYERYNNLLSIKSKQINCEKQFKDFDDFVLHNWLERLYIERLEEKSKLILNLLDQSKNNWEQVLFIMLCKNFGLNKNGQAFLKTAQSIDYKLIVKHHTSIQDLEALFLGQSNLLDIESEEQYITDLKKRYKYFKHKYQLKPSPETPQFFRLRPDNFPTLRMAELASVYHKHPQLFQKIIRSKTKVEIYNLFNTSLTEFWDVHYSLTKKSKAKTKTLNKSFINLLIINTIVPIQFCYYKQTNASHNFEVLFELMQSIKAEENSKVNVFENLRTGTNKNAMVSQALLELKTKYCDKNYCLKCHLGKRILNQSSV
jgi:hypothetical protein